MPQADNDEFHGPRRFPTGKIQLQPSPPFLCSPLVSQFNRQDQIFERQFTNILYLASYPTKFLCYLYATLCLTKHPCLQPPGRLGTSKSFSGMTRIFFVYGTKCVFYILNKVSMATHLHDADDRRALHPGFLCYAHAVLFDWVDKNNCRRQPVSV
jgi:hypothetical protein